MSEQVTWALIADIMDDVDGMGAGIPPRDLQAFSSESTEDGVLLKFTPPKPTYLNEHTSGDGKQFACMPGGVLIMYSEESYPRSPEEGKIACNYVPDGDWTTEQQTFEVTGLTKEHTYYFTAFPYSVNGVYNTNQIAENRTSMTWVGNSGTISVNVKTPKGYTGELGEYTITLLDQSADNPQNEQKTATGAGLTRFGGLTAGKSYKVRLGTPEDESLIAPADSEAITIVGGQNNNVTMAYVYKNGTLKVTVSANVSVVQPGSYTVTLTPTKGGEPIQKTQSNFGEITFEAIAGSYTLSFSSANKYNAPQNQSVQIKFGETTTTSATYTALTGISNYSMDEIYQITRAGKAQNLFSVGDKIKLKYHYLRGKISRSSPSYTFASEDILDFIVVDFNKYTNVDNSSQYNIILLSAADVCTITLEDARFYATNAPAFFGTKSNVQSIFPDYIQYITKLKVQRNEQDPFNPAKTYDIYAYSPSEYEYGATSTSSYVEKPFTYFTGAWTTMCQRRAIGKRYGTCTYAQGTSNPNRVETIEIDGTYATNVVGQRDGLPINEPTPHRLFIAIG